MRPRLLDLFCKAGGAARGYQLAGFHVTGIDHQPQPRFKGDVFIMADALEYAATHGCEFDAIHASPPCQRYSCMRHLSARVHPDLVAPTRDVLTKTCVPWIIENVVGAPLISPIMLCGSSFSLDLRRHRLFESNVPLIGKPCDHAWQTPRFPANRSDGGRCGKLARVVVVAGHDTRKFNHLTSVVSVHGGTQGAGGVAEWRRAMQIDWMTRDELSQAVPPAYTRFIGSQLLEVLANDP